MDVNNLENRIFTLMMVMTTANVSPIDRRNDFNTFSFLEQLHSVIADIYYEHIYISATMKLLFIYLYFYFQVKYDVTNIDKNKTITINTERLNTATLTASK